ncbi:MAG: hypothetical protein V1792_13380 [Pseudomonadota bacterium]
MIYVKQERLDEDAILIDVSGVLDEDAVPVLQDVCRRHLDRGRKVAVNLEGITHITREGRSFIQDIRNSVELVHVPEFVKTGDLL